MRSARFVPLLVLFVFARSATAQQATAAPPQATALLQQSLVALTGGHPLTDITLSGTAHRIAGSDDESGTVVIQALAGTGSTLALTLPSGPRTELRNVSAPVPVGSWSGPDGVAHAMAYHNLLTDPGWAPALTIAALLSAPNAAITYVGPETHKGQSVIHVSASQQFPALTGTPATLMQHLTQTDVYLDAGTGLPDAIAFNSHADSNALVDVAVEVDFSSYQTVSGAQIPLHVQQFINNSLALDLRLSSATLNSGLASSIFAVAGAQ
jgi:hypothetical protein